MSKGSDWLRNALMLLATTATALGTTLALPVKKALAAPRAPYAPPASAVDRAPVGLEIIQPRRVDPTAVRLLKITESALSDKSLADSIFSDPDAVAAQYHLSENETVVLHHMTREQFDTARADAARVVATRMSRAGTMRMPPGATDRELITERMIVGRAILAAVGRSYLNAADAHDCCPWSKAIELGVNSDPAYFNAVFERPAIGPGVNSPQ